MSGFSIFKIELDNNLLASLTKSTVIYSFKCTLANPSDRRIKLSNYLTVIL